MTVHEDASLPHQIRLEHDTKRNLLYVSCNCMRVNGRYTPLIDPLSVRPVTVPPIVIEAYAEHLKEVNRPS